MIRRPPRSTPLSLHDALPILEVNRLVEFLETSGGSLRTAFEQERERASEQLDFERARTLHKKVEKLDEVRSEEHTSELQSQSNLVCRLLLEKKKVQHQLATYH